MDKVEIWLDIKGFEGKYQVSNTGYAKSLNYNNTGKEKILIPKVNKQGQYEISLSKDNKIKYCILSRLIFETFYEIKLSRNEIIMYKDGNKTNCALENLYKITRGQRQEITYDNDNRYRPKHEFYGKKLATKDISNMTGIDSITIRNRIHRLYWNIYEAAEIPKAVQKRGEKINNENEF